MRPAGAGRAAAVEAAASAAASMSDAPLTPRRRPPDANDVECERTVTVTGAGGAGVGGKDTSSRACGGGSAVSRRTMDAE